MDKKDQDIITPEAMEEAVSRKTPKTTWSKGTVVGLLAASLVAVCGVAFGISRNTMQEKPSAHTDKGGEGGKIVAASNYEEVYAYMDDYLKNQVDSQAPLGGQGNIEERGKESLVENATDSTALRDYSGTNVRQEGVEEADVVKTDGDYLYVLKDGGASLSIVDPKEGALQKQGEIVFEEGVTAVEFFLKGGRLVVVSGSNSWNYGVMPLDGARADTYEKGEPVTKLITYDISDVSAPKKVGEVSQSGFYATARMEGDYVYLFSRHTIYNRVTLEDSNTFIPSINGTLIPKEKIALPQEKAANMYEIITSLHIEKPEELKDSMAILSFGGELYMSNEHIYWYEPNWETNETSIRKFSYKEGTLGSVAQAKVKGLIDDSFSVDEYKGYLRVVTTSQESNGVYIFDQGMNQTGAIEGIAEKEQVRSARFLEDTAYFVTFKQTDPLFSVDLSNPENPKILGALKIPGFSEYLHFYGENQLLGIGIEVEEETMSTRGVKLSMFDISDNTDVKETNKHVMENMYSTEALYDYKAVLIEEEKNIIGFSGFEGGGEYYNVFSYDDKKGFVCDMKEVVNGSGMTATRGVFIKNSLYVVKGNIIEQYSLEGYKKTGDLIL